MSWPLVKVGDVSTFIRGITFKPEDLVEPHSDNSIVVLRTKNVQVLGLDVDDLIAVSKSLGKRDEQIVRDGDLLISSANSWELVGKVSYVQSLGFDATAGGFISIVRPNADIIDARYFYHWITQSETQLKIRMCGRKTTNISNLDVGRFKELTLPLPPLPEQKRIAAILDKADAIRRKRQQAIKLADDFLRSVFFEMFGDPVTNPKGWDIEYLPNIGVFKNGLNYGKDESGVSISCLGVGDFKSLDRIDSVQLLSKINLDSVPSDEYLLRDGDLVFVRSNGNGALVGRCLSVWPGSEKLTFSGFCIRFRAIKNGVSSDYLNHLFRMPSIKHEMLKGGQGANIQNINQQKLSEIKIPMPPEQLQVKFSNLANAFRDALSRNCSSLDEIQSLFSSLSQKAFSGNL